MDAPASSFSTPRSFIQKIRASIDSVVLARHSVVLHVTPEGIRVTRRDRPVPLDRVVKRSGDLVLLVIPAELILEQRIQVPLGVLADLDTMLPLHLRRWSPFDPELMVTVARGRPLGASFAEVTLRHAPRAGLATLAPDLAATRGAPDGFRFGPEPEWTLVSNQGKLRRHRRWIVADGLLAGCAALLFGAFVVSAFSQISERRRAIETETASLAREVAESVALQEKLAAVRSIKGAVQGLPPRRTFLNAILAALSERLPQGASVKTFKLTDTEMEVVLALGPGTRVPDDLELPGWSRIGSVSTRSEGGEIGSAAKLRFKRASR